MPAKAMLGSSELWVQVLVVKFGCHVLGRVWGLGFGNQIHNSYMFGLLYKFCVRTQGLVSGLEV